MTAAESVSISPFAEEDVLLKRRTEPPAETPCSREVLRRIYRRQFNELAPLRRHIFSLLPLSQVKTIFEPGCGTGLLGQQLMSLTDAVYTGMDIDRQILPEGENFVQGDALKKTPSADLYVSGFFFSSLGDPAKWLNELKIRYFAVFSEYDYMSIEEKPSMNIAARLRKGLEADGLFTGHGGRLDEYFQRAGFRKLHGGDVESDCRKPDEGFLKMYVPFLTGELPLMSWRIVWGIWRKQ